MGQVPRRRRRGGGVKSFSLFSKTVPREKTRTSFYTCKKYDTHRTRRTRTSRTSLLSFRRRVHHGAAAATLHPVRADRRRARRVKRRRVSRRRFFFFFLFFFFVAVVLHDVREQTRALLFRDRGGCRVGVRAGEKRRGRRVVVLREDERTRAKGGRKARVVFSFFFSRASATNARETM